MEGLHGITYHVMWTWGGWSEGWCPTLNLWATIQTVSFLPVELSIVISWLSGSSLVVVYPHMLTSTTRSPDVIHVICVLAQCVILNTNWRTKKHGTGFLLGEGFDLPAPPWICWESNQSFTATINGKLCSCENSPRFHQIASNKIKISRWNTSPDPPTLPHALHTDMYLLPQ